MKGTKMAELKCKDGTVIKISDETEAELRKVFGPKPEPKLHYKDACLEVLIEDSVDWPVCIKASSDNRNNKGLTRDIEDTESFIAALQEAVAYCKRNDLG